MFESVCTYPLPSDLFSQAIHPSLPLISVGLASGHVHTLRLPSLELHTGSLSNSITSNSSTHSNTSSSSTSSSSRLSVPNGRGGIETIWKTKRHPGGSCRSVVFSYDGEKVVSAGSDGMVKVAATETGRVEWKIGVPMEGSVPPSPSLLHPLTPSTLLLATDTSALHIYDFRAPASASSPCRPQSTFRPHEDYISSLTPLPASSVSSSSHKSSNSNSASTGAGGSFTKQFISTGGATLAITDLRRGVLAQSEDQEEELLSCVYVSGLGKRGSSVGEKVLVGGASGVLTLWERGAWDDQDERIVVSAGKGGGESLDCLAVLPDGVGGGGKGVCVGMGDGRVRVVRLGRNQVVGECKHDEVEGVVGLGFEVGGRMVSGGGGVVKVWQEREEGASEEEEEEGEETMTGKRAGSDGEDGSDQSEGESSEEEAKGRKRRKKRKRNRGKDKTGGGKATLTAFKGMD